MAYFNSDDVDVIVMGSGAIFTETIYYSCLELSKEKDVKMGKDHRAKHARREDILSLQLILDNDGDTR